MTSGTILPSIGPPPPEFRRPYVPENLRPKLGGGTAVQPAADPIVARSEPREAGRPEGPPLSPQSVSAADGARKQQPAGQSTALSPSPTSVASNLGRSSAVALQVRESQTAEASTRSEEPRGLSDEDRAEIRRLKERDREVRAHENAHASTGGGYTGSPSFEYATGPDGVQYAVGGHVNIDVSEVPNDPEATIAKLEVVRSAALAPARPSGQDRAVAAAAAAKSREAEAELAEARREEASEALAARENGSQPPAAQNGDTGFSAGSAEAASAAPTGLFGGTSTATAPSQISIDLLV